MLAHALFVGASSLSLLGGTAAWPLVARAQDITKRIGVLWPYAESDKTFNAHLALFRSALEQLGWSEGRNLRIDYRYAGGEMDRSSLSLTLT